MQKQQMITPHFLGGVAPLAPSPRGWESACRVRRAPKPNCFGLPSCGSGIPLLRPIGSLEPLLCCAEGVIGAPVCSVRSGGPGPAIAQTRGGLLDRWAATMVVLRVHASGHQRMDYTMAHAACSYGHRADKTSHTMSMSMMHPDCPHRGIAIESVKYCTLKQQYLLNR